MLNVKRIIFISILSAFIFSLFLAFAIVGLRNAEWQLEYIEGSPDNETLREYGLISLRNGLLFLAGSLCTIALYALFAVKEFKVFQPYVDKFNAKRNARKQERAAARAAKAETDTQKRIEELQAELDELQDKTNSNP